MFAEYSLLVFELLQLAVAHMARKQAVQERREERRGGKMNITTTPAYVLKTCEFHDFF
jgi:hypothetical protein